MKKINSILVSIFLLSFLFGCAENFESEGEKDKPIMVGGNVSVSNILHDSPKVGDVSFKVTDNFTSSTYLWQIMDDKGKEIPLKVKDKREITVNFTKAGKYTVTLKTDKNKAEGLITIPDISNYEIDLGDNHTIISNTKSKELYVYGLNDLGQLCIYDNNTRAAILPVLVQGYDNITSVAAGRNHTLFVNGEYVYGCGDNKQGQLGIAHTNNVNEISLVSTIPDNIKYSRVFVSAGGDMSVAGTEFSEGQSSKMQIYTWGYDESSDGKINSSAKPAINSPAPSRQEPLFTTGVNLVFSERQVHIMFFQ